MKSKYSYTLNDILELLTNSSYNPWTDTGSSIVKEIIEENISSSVVASLGEIGTMSGATFTYATHVAKVVDNVYRLHNENYCVFVDLEASASSESKRFLMKFLTLLNQTAPRYKELLTYYKAEETKLLDRLKTTSSGLAKFNDTPQGSGDYSDDTHTTNITSTSGETEVEIKTPIERLKEIQDSYSDVLARWSEEFDNLFLEEGNLAYD